MGRQLLMRPILLDTNAYTDFMLGKDQIVELIALAERIYLNSTVLGELLGGFSVGKKTSQNRLELTKFLSSPRVTILSVTNNTADFYAEIYANLRRKGRPIPSNDMWIAASAMESSAILITRDSHFNHIENLRTGQTAADIMP